MIRIERKEEIIINCDSIHDAVEHIYYEIGHDLGRILNEEYIIDEILMVASPVMRYKDEDELEAWRKQIDKRVWDNLIDIFWCAYKGYADSEFTISVENTKARLKRSN